MKKIFMLTTVLLIGAVSLKAQGMFSQKQTQIKYLLKDIAALKVYIGYVKDGYNIAKNGLNTIGDIKRGEFNLHKDHFNSLKEVNPAVRNYKNVNAILNMQQQLLQQIGDYKDRFRSQETLTPREQRYAINVYDRLLADCHETLDMLRKLIRQGDLQMKDDERIRRIDGLYTLTLSQYSFSQHFTNDLKSLIGNRIKEQKDISNSRALHGIK